MKRVALSALAVFVFVFAYDFLIHGILLMGQYEATSEVWRPQEEAQMIFMMLSQLMFAIVLSAIFRLNYEGKGIGEGIRFGLYIGLLIASLDIGRYCYLPVPLSLVAMWFLANILKCTGAGVVLSATYRGSETV